MTGYLRIVYLLSSVEGNQWKEGGANSGQLTFRHISLRRKLIENNLKNQLSKSLVPSFDFIGLGDSC